MFSRDIIRTDRFMEMPPTARDLYTHLNMDADDDGIVANPVLTMKICGAGPDDLKLLLTKNFIIGFDSGVVAIKHWRIHNEIKRDRYKPTNWQDEINTLKIKDNGAYSLDEGQPLSLWNQDGATEEAQVRLGKVRLGKKNTLSEAEKNRHIENFNRVWSAYPKKVGKQDAKRWWERQYFTDDVVEQMLEAIRKYKNTEQWQKGFIPHPSTWFHRGSWEDEITEDAKKPEEGFKSYAQR